MRPTTRIALIAGTAVVVAVGAVTVALQSARRQNALATLHATAACADIDRMLAASQQDLALATPPLTKAPEALQLMRETVRTVCGATLPNLGPWSIGPRRTITIELPTARLLALGTEATAELRGRCAARAAAAAQADHDLAVRLKPDDPAGVPSIDAFVTEQRARCEAIQFAPGVFVPDLAVPVDARVAADLLGVMADATSLANKPRAQHTGGLEHADFHVIGAKSPGTFRVFPTPRPWPPGEVIHEVDVVLPVPPTLQAEGGVSVRVDGRSGTALPLGKGRQCREAFGWSGPEADQAAREPLCLEDTPSVRVRLRLHGEEEVCVAFGIREECAGRNVPCCEPAVEPQ